MKKLLAILLICLPLSTFAQVKPGIPISEVVRQAKAEAAAEKGRAARRVKETTAETNKQWEPQPQQRSQQPVASQYDNFGYTFQPVFTHETQAEKAIKSPRAFEPKLRTARPERAKCNFPRFTDQLDFSRQFGLSISTNGLMWLAAVPNIDVRLQLGKFSLMGSAAYSSWDIADLKYWWTTSFAGELHYDITPNVYIGAMYNWYNYNYKLSETGHQGLAQSLGVVAGYKLPISRSLSLDFGIGLGYALIDNEKYHEQGTALIRDERRTFGYWGLTKAQVSLVWRIL